MLSNVCACHCITAAWASPSLPCHLPSFALFFILCVRLSELSALLSRGWSLASSLK